MIDKETANALALEAYLGLGKELISGPAYDLRLCNLAIAHAQKDVGKILITPGGGAPGDPCGILAAKDAEPVAYRLSPRYEDKEGYFNFTDSKKTADTFQARGWTITPLFTHTAHDDTALLRQALEALKELWDNFGVVCPSADLIDQYEAAIAALRKRLGEKA